MIVKCENVALAYEGKQIVENLNFTVENGDYLCIVGENGSGKTTLMKALLGLKNPSSGKIIFGEGIKSGDIGYLPQQTLIQRDFPASVKEVVISGCTGKAGLKPFFGRKEKQTAENAMKKMGIESISKKCYRELSGGQQQRVLLARALCAAEKLLILDEPVSGLDPVVTGEMYKIIDELNKKDGITIIMVSHDINAAAHYASHILHIGQEPLFFGKTEDYLQSDAWKEFSGNTGESNN